MVNYLSGSKNGQNVLSKKSIHGTTNEKIDGGWERVTLTFTVPENNTPVRVMGGIFNQSGTAWFDCFQLEPEDSANAFTPYRAVNFKLDAEGIMICPTGRKFVFKYNKHVRGNNYGRTGEVYEYESCEGCPCKSECCRSAKGNRTIRLNRELTSFHKEVISNLESIHKALLCMNRCIQSEGTFGIIKWDKSYKRLFRRGKESVLLELILISCGYNLYKYHNKKNRVNCTAA